MVMIKEIFTSIQGEGPFVGYKQLFIRFCGCNLKCAYCDTDYDSNNAQDYTVNEILQITKNCSDIHSISLTGGEPLLNTEFIKELSKVCKLPLYLETNGTLPQKLEEIIDCISFIAADIKLQSATGHVTMWNEHEAFFRIACQKELFAKAVFDNNINDIEIHKIAHLCKKFDIELILQPMMRGKSICVTSEFMQNVLDKCLVIHNKTRLIPQVHKFIGII